MVRWTKIRHPKYGGPERQWVAADTYINSTDRVSLSIEKDRWGNFRVHVFLYKGKRLEDEYESQAPQTLQAAKAKCREILAFYKRTKGEWRYGSV